MMNDNPRSNKTKERLTIFILFVISLIAFLVNQYKEGITNYITRFVDFSNYMLAHGMTLFPMLSATEPFPDYTSASPGLVYLFSLPFGKISVLSLGLPFCIAAALLVVFTYQIGALHDKKWGLYGALFTFLTWGFIQEVHFLALDVYAAFATVFCFYCVHAADVLVKKSYLYFVPLGFIIGFLFRGPIGLITPALIVGCYYFFSRQWRLFFIFSVISGLLLVACTALLSWAAYIQGGLPFMKDVLAMQGLGRIVNNHAPRIYFYFTLGILHYFFTIFFAFIVIIKKFKSIFSPKEDPKLKLLFQLCIWFVVIILFFTIPNSKKARYILAITPAISLIAAYLFLEKNRLFTTAINILQFICLYMPVIGLVILVLIYGYNQIATVHLQPYFFIALTGLLVMLVISLLIKSHYESSQNRDFIIMVFGAIVFLYLNTVVVYPINYHLELLDEPDPKYLQFWL